MSREQRRAVKKLADTPRGLTEHFLLARGFSVEMLSNLVLTNLATVVTEVGGFAVDQAVALDDIGEVVG